MLEYGYALRARSHSVMIPVMNVAYGPADKLPFDMGHLRHPLQYQLPATAKNAERRAVRKALTEEFETILRLMIADARTRLSKATPFPEASPTFSPAFFFPPGAAIAGFGHPGEQEYRFEGDRAIYLRLFPKFNDGQTRPGRTSLRTLVHDRHVLNAMAPTIAGITAPKSRKRGGACRVTRRPNAPKRPQLFAAPWPKGCPAPTKDRIENMEEDRMTYHVSRQSLLALGSSFSASSLLDGPRAVPSAGKTGMARRGLTGGALLASCLLTWDSVAAQSPSETEKIERLERQSELLQKQLNRQNDLIRELQQEVTRARKKSEKKETELAKRSEPSVNSREPEPSVNSKQEEPPPYVPTQAEIIRGTQPAISTPVAKFPGVQFSVWGISKRRRCSATTIRSTIC
jgi:hypothetical protein